MTAQLHAAKVCSSQDAASDAKGAVLFVVNGQPIVCLALLPDNGVTCLFALFSAAAAAAACAACTSS